MLFIQPSLNRFFYYYKRKADVTCWTVLFHSTIYENWQQLRNETCSLHECNASLVSWHLSLSARNNCKLISCLNGSKTPGSRPCGIDVSLSVKRVTDQNAFQFINIRVRTRAPNVIFIRDFLFFFIFTESSNSAVDFNRNVIGSETLIPILC